MGKSPGKWIKILLGKKSSKSQETGGRVKTQREKEKIVTSESRGTDLDLVKPFVSSPTVNAVVEPEPSSEVKEDRSNVEVAVPDVTPSDEETLNLEKSAYVVQAAFRGYLARRAFRALKGIIRLQAVIRGHLVRRQAVATLCCLFQIVKLQAVVRGNKIRSSYAWKKCNIKLLPGSPSSGVNHENITHRIIKNSSNAFVRMLLVPSPTVMPLNLFYDSTEPNSVPNWLDRWSRSCFWKPLRVQTKPLPLKHQRKPDVESVRPKRSVRRIPPVNLDNNLGWEFEKPKRSLRKVATQIPENIPENPQSEFEKVKRNLRKVQSQNPAAVEAIVHQESELEKPKKSVEKVSSAHGDNGFVEGTIHSTEKHSDFVLQETDVLPSAIDSNNSLQEHEKKESQPLFQEETDEKCESYTLPNGDQTCKDEEIRDEDHKPEKKTINLTKERIENGLQSSPTVPSYMAATESAKAKLRAQGSPQIDSSERSNSARRHSLPSATTKPISHSPRTQRTGSDKKFVSKTEKSSSKDSNGKVEWRR